MTHAREPTNNALAALADLTRGFFDPAAVVQGTQPVEPALIPDLPRTLLVHHDHMTVALESAAGCPVELTVLKENREGDDYARMIHLKPRGSDRVVEFGILRLDLRVTAPEVRREVLGGTAPLGTILIRHNVLRSVEPRGYLRFDASSPVTRAFGDPTLAESFGRVATIYYEGKRAIDLLEVVRGA